jgi:hypothetical protein
LVSAGYVSRYQKSFFGIGWLRESIQKMGSGAQGREFVQRRLKNFGRQTWCRVSIKKFKAHGARRPLSPYLLVFTLSARHHFILRLSISPPPPALSLTHAWRRRRPVAGGARVSLGSGDHDHGVGHDRRHDASEARRHRSRTSGGVSEVWHGAVVLVPTTA